MLDEMCATLGGRAASEMKPQIPTAIIWGENDIVTPPSLIDLTMVFRVWDFISS